MKVLCFTLTSGLDLTLSPQIIKIKAQEMWQMTAGRNTLLSTDKGGIH